MHGDEPLESVSPPTPAPTASPEGFATIIVSAELLARSFLRLPKDYRLVYADWEESGGHLRFIVTSPHYPPCDPDLEPPTITPVYHGTLDGQVVLEPASLALPVPPATPPAYSLADAARLGLLDVLEAGDEATAPEP